MLCMCVCDVSAPRSCSLPPSRAVWVKQHSTRETLDSGIMTTEREHVGAVSAGTNTGVRPTQHLHKHKCISVRMLNDPTHSVFQCVSEDSSL